MDSGRRPIAVLIVSCLYLAVGSVGCAVNIPKLLTFQPEGVWIELTEVLAMVAGVFMLCRQNWARWLALAWMTFHVVISFPVLRQVAVHLVFLGVITWCLFYSDSRRYFRATE